MSFVSTDQLGFSWARQFVSFQLVELFFPSSKISGLILCPHALMVNRNMKSYYQNSQTIVPLHKPLDKADR